MKQYISELKKWLTEIINNSNKDIVIEDAQICYTLVTLIEEELERRRGKEVESTQ